MSQGNDRAVVKRRYAPRAPGRSQRGVGGRNAPGAGIPRVLADPWASCGYGRSVKNPGRVVAPGPARPAEASTAGLLVTGMQNTDASVTAFAVESGRFPAGVPVSVIERQVDCPKHPARPK